jgi:hypothetical protein
MGQNRAESHRQCVAAMRRRWPPSRTFFRRVIGLEDLQNFLGECLHNSVRRIGQRAGQRHERAILLLVIGRTQWATMQFLRAKDRIEGNGAI